MLFKSGIERGTGLSPAFFKAMLFWGVFIFLSLSEGKYIGKVKGFDFASLVPLKRNALWSMHFSFLRSTFLEIFQAYLKVETLVQ
jgi:hypothetical protein